MSNATDHYENLLAEHYTWMFGVSAADKAAEQLELLRRSSVVRGELAVDLGAGSGFQSLALADIGFTRVLAIDTSAKLLEELRLNRGGRRVDAIQSDMMELSRHVAPGTADAIVCMGDTLPHLPVRELIPQLFAEVSRTLRKNGRFVLSFRDSSAELSGVDRFIPVRSTADKIMTCFLEYGADVIKVHDLIHIRGGSAWRLVKSCYSKLRLSADDIHVELAEAGFKVDTQESFRGMSVLAAQKV
jgi:SAM-dependent methyltransferase